MMPQGFSCKKPAVTSIETGDERILIAEGERKAGNICEAGDNGCKGINTKINERGNIDMCALFAKNSRNETKSEGKPDPAEAFLQEFETTEEELTVLLKDFSKGGSVKGDYVFPSAAFMAYIDNESGEIIQEKGTLHWVILRSANDYIHDFKDYGIYRVLVRKCKPDVKNFLGNPYKNRYHIVKIIAENVKEPRLEAIRDEYLKPVSFEDKAGTFCLDRKYGWFEGKIDWLGTFLKVLLDKDENSDTAEKALQTLHRFLEDTEKWDKTLRTFAAVQLTALANDWQDGEAPEITEEEFAKRIGAPSFRINNDGSFEAEYEDDDMFYGHWVVVYGRADGELKEAHIEG